MDDFLRSIHSFLLPFTILISLVPVGVAYFRTRPLDRASQIIAISVFVSMCFNDASMQVVYYAAKHPEIQSSYPIMHLYLLVQCYLLSWFYTRVFADSPRLVRSVIVVGSLLAIYTIINSIPKTIVDDIPILQWTDGWLEPASRALTAQSLFFVVLSLTYLYRIFANSPIDGLNPTNTALFWFNGGILIYFSLSFFAFAYWRELLNSGRWMISILIHQGANIVLNAFYTIGLLCKPPTSRIQI